MKRTPLVPPQAPAAPPADTPGEAQACALPVTRTARYYRQGQPGGALWVVIHGYGQLARYFLRSFGGVAGAARLVVAPEALGRFYLDAAHHRVGASWMTREHRDAEIADYVAYLDAVYDAVAPAWHGAPVPVHVLGFSQGAETASRWAVFGKAPVQALTLWGGRLPLDLDLAAHAERLTACRLTLVNGQADEVVTPAHVAELEARLRRHGLPYAHLLHEGGHRLDGEVLQRLAAMEA